MAHIKLSHSRAFLLRAYPLQTHDRSHRARTDGAAMASMFDADVPAFRVFGGVPARGIHDSEAGPPSVRGPAERALLLIVSAGARSGRSMPGFWRWPAIMSSGPRSAVLLRVGASHWCAIGSSPMAAVRLRRPFRIHGTGFGSCYPEGICGQITQGNAGLSRPCRAECLAGTALHGTLARDPARRAVRQRRRCPAASQMSGPKNRQS